MPTIPRPSEGAQHAAVEDAARCPYAAPAPVRQMWREEPVREVVTEFGMQAWLITGMDEVRFALSDPRFSRAEARRLGAVAAPSAAFEKPGINDLDPPEHPRMRRLVAGAFSGHRIRALRPRLQQITDELIAPLIAVGPPADLIAGLCKLLPLTVIFEILGVPQQDKARFSEWVERIMVTIAYPTSEGSEALQAVIAYMTDLVAAKRREPDNSLLAELIAARDEDDRLSEQELVYLGCGLLAAGNESTATMLGKGLLALLDNPDDLAAVRADPSLVPSVVQEVLRYIPLGSRPLHGQVRATTADVEFGGVTVPAHSVVLASLPAANMDPAQFAEPDRFDIRRAGADKHVTFGYGPHRCLGAQLARMELEVAFRTVLTTFPEIRLAVPTDELANTEGRLMAGLQELPVTW